MKAINASRKRPVQIPEIMTHIEQAYAIDHNLHQNIIVSIERLVSKNGDTNSAANLCIAAIRVIGSHDSKAALYIGYSVMENVLDYRIYRTMIQFHNKLNQHSVSLILLDCLDSNEWVEQKKRELIERALTSEETRDTIVFQQLAKSHRESIQIASGENKSYPIDSSFHHSPIFDMPMTAWKRRDLLFWMVSRDIRLKYQKSLLGWFWAVIEPLALTLTFLFLFEILATAPEQYRPLNIMIGVMVWSSFGYIMLRGTKFLEANAGTLQRVSLPRHLFLLNISGTAMTTLILNLLAIIPLLIYYELIPSARILLLPLALILITIYACGIVLITSTLQTKWRDFSQIIGVGVRIGFYFTPVFFTLDMLMKSRIPPDYLSTYLLLNPMAIFLTMSRSAFTNQPLGVDSMMVAASVAHALVIYCIGSYWFRKKNDTAVKYL